MTTGEWVTEQAGYAEELARSAWEGAASGWNQRPEPQSDVRKYETAISVASATLGAAAGAASGMLCSSRNRKRNAVVGGVVGGALALAGATAWCFRAAIECASKGASKNVENTRNLHWLEKNPIDYA